MRLPAWLIGVFDPAQRYMARSAPRRRGGRRRRPPRARSSYAPLTNGGRGRPADARSAPPPPELEEEVRRRRAEREAALDRAYGVHADALRRASGELASSGTTEIGTPGGTVSARVIRFWRGSSVLEIETRFVERHRQGDGAARDLGRGTSSRTRIRRTGEAPDTYRHHLASALADLEERPDAGSTG